MAFYGRYYSRVGESYELSIMIKNFTPREFCVPLIRVSNGSACTVRTVSASVNTRYTDSCYGRGISVEEVTKRAPKIVTQLQQIDLLRHQIPPN